MNHGNSHTSFARKHRGQAAKMNRLSAAELARELADTSDGLRAFEIIDNSGYVLCFGRPREK